MRQTNRVALAVVLCGLTGGLGVGSAGAQFTQGSLAVSRIGDGAQTLSANGNSIFIDRFSTTGTGQTASYTVALPTTGANTAILTSGIANAEGVLNLSGNGQYLTYFGYGRELGGGTSGLPGTASTTVNRVAARIGLDGTVDTSTRLSDAYSANSARAAYTLDGTSFYLAGGPGSNDSGGIRYAVADFDNTSDTSTSISTTITETRVLDAVTIAGSTELYFSVGTGANRGIYRVGPAGTGFPTTGPVTASLLVNTGVASSTYGFFFANDNTVYVADDRAGAAGGLFRYTRSNTSSAFAIDNTFSVSIPAVGSGTIGLRGLTGFVNQSGDVELFAITADDTPSSTTAPGNRLVKITDRTASADSVEILAQAANGTVFRGLDYIPFALVDVPEPSSVGFVVAGGLLSIGLIRRRRVSNK